MKVSGEIWPAVIPPAAIFLACVLMLFFCRPKNIFTAWNFYVALIALILCLLSVRFFRDPEINVEEDNSFILSPASGRVLGVETSLDKTVVRIFMNILDYHIQRAPCSGRIKEINYIRGKFSNAASSDAHAGNERNKVLFETAGGKNVMVTQIAGSVARRILCWKNKGDSVKQGEKIGMIKFGSQVDCEFPETCEVLVHAGDRVNCAKTKLAKWQSE
ncbi:MAG: phosphatidylserine decarboxylase [bacterium]